MGKRILLTGGTGFIGANLIRRLLSDDHEVNLLVRPSYRPWRIEAILPDVHLHVVSLEDKSALTAIVRQARPDWVFHLAAHGAYPLQSDLKQMVRTNILGTINLVEACLEIGFESFVNTGSSSEYGFKDHPPSESELLEPNSHYAVTKASASMFCGYTAQTRGASLTTLRLYSVFGPFEDPSRLIPTLIVRGKSGELPPLVEPEVARDFVYADDVVDAYRLAASRPSKEKGAVFNVGTGVQTSLRQVVEVARQALSIEKEPQWGTMPNRRWDTPTWVSNPSRIRSQLGWRPRYTFEEGFREFVEWFDDNPAFMELYLRRRRELD